MSKKNDILKIWTECFPGDSPRWRHMFFDAVYVDDEALTIVDEESQKTVSSLLLLSYAMTFRNSTVGLAYIYGAGTLKKYRARGYMSRLLRLALREASDRGDSFIALIPASDSLRRYYQRYGFSTVFFSRPERYTSVHSFDFSGSYVEIDDSHPLLPAFFARQMAARPCCVQHSRAQFLTLMDDARLSGHAFVAIADAATRLPMAMLWAENEMASSVLRVKELLAEDSDAANAALQLLKTRYPDSPLTIMRQPSDDYIGGNLLPGAMARIVNAENILRAVAADNPQLTLIIRLTDPLLPENNGVYTLTGGTLTITDTPTPETRLNLDLTPEVLTSMLFSSTPISRITGLPACRPHLSLMLD